MMHLLQRLRVVFIDSLNGDSTVETSSLTFKAVAEFNAGPSPAPRAGPGVPSLKLIIRVNNLTVKISIFAELRIHETLQPLNALGDENMRLLWIHVWIKRCRSAQTTQQFACALYRLIYGCPFATSGGNAAMDRSKI